MFFLITGASGVGKSTVRRLIQAEFNERVETAELCDVADSSEWDLRWRHQTVEKAVRRALAAQGEGKHYMLCGDPVPSGELYAAPSADALDAIAVCLLDASEEAQRQRLMKRGDDPSLLPRHIAFAEWMREHIADPGHRPEVIMRGGWEEMRWDRWITRGRRQTPWDCYVVDTTERSPVDVGLLVSAWIRRHLSPEGE